MVHIDGKFGNRTQTLSTWKQDVLILVLVNRGEQGYS